MNQESTSFPSNHQPGLAGYRNLRPLTLVFLAFVLLSAAATAQHLVTLGSCLHDNRPVPDLVSALDEWDRNGAFPLAFFQPIASLVTAVTWFFWAFAIRRNLDHLGIRGLQTSAWGLVLWHFVPVANLWKPYFALKETWLASLRLTKPRQPVPEILITWWLIGLFAELVIVPFMIAAIVGRSVAILHDPFVQILMSALHLVHLVLTVIVVAKMASDQTRVRERLVSRSSVATENAWRNLRIPERKLPGGGVKR